MAKHYLSPDPVLRRKLSVAARQMRQAPTPAEAVLWEKLRGRQLAGRKIHRQHQIDQFIVDFYCPDAGLIIEVDGKIHHQQAEADREREQLLTALGFRVIRFTNEEVLDQTEQVLDRIRAVLS
jgi:very-short-patch-repair endonuclease